MDDVPRTRQGALRRDWCTFGRHETDRHLARAELGDWPAGHARARLALSARPPRVSQRSRADRPRALHCDGVALERAGVWLGRNRGGARRVELRFPDSHLLRARLALSKL